MDNRMKQTQQEILETLANNRSKIQNFGVRRLGLFGSGARENRSETSDFDFVVEFEKKSFDGCMDLKFFLEDLFLCPVDLVIHDAIKLRLRETILKESVYVQGL